MQVLYTTFFGSLELSNFGAKMPKSGEVKCFGCSKFFLISGIQAHLRHNQECKNKFSLKAYNNLKELCEAQKKKNVSSRKAKNYQNQKCQENTVEGSGQADDSSISSDSYNVKHKCKGCARQFAKNGFMKHLAKKADCKAKYTQKEFEGIKREKRRKAQSEKYQKRKKLKSNEEQTFGDSNDGGKGLPSENKNVIRHLTNGDLFFQVYSAEFSPFGRNKKEMISKWVKSNILKKSIIDSNESKWLKDFVTYFDNNAKRIWNRNDGQFKEVELRKRHWIFFDRYIKYNESVAQNKKNKINEKKPVGRPKEEIDNIIKTLKEIRESSFYICMWQMAENLKSDVYILRKMSE